MYLYWQERRKGQRLIVKFDEETTEEVGGVRETSRGFDAFAKTFGYEPGRAEKGMASMEEAKAFVESFRPWELYPGTETLTVEPVVRPQPSDS